MKSSGQVSIFAGANGSGKSSILERFIEEQKEYDYLLVSPDEVVKEPQYDIYEDTRDRYGAAMTFCERARNAALLVGKNVVFETVLSTDEKLDYLRKAKQSGSTIFGIYVTTTDPSINARRVADRVAKGGHDVPLDKVHSRYKRSMERLPSLFSLCDSFVLYDNSVDDRRPQINMFLDLEGNLFLFNPTSLPSWISNPTDDFLLHCMTSANVSKTISLTGDVSEKFLKEAIARKSSKLLYM